MSATAERYHEEKSEHMRLVVQGEHAELILHTPREKVNKLSRAAFAELSQNFSLLRAKSDVIKTLLIYSDKQDMFLAGADIRDIEAMTEPSEALDMVRKAQEVFQQLADLPQVTLVAIDGTCLGGGLELSLACRYRICSDSKATQLGLPEVKLGVLPGAGGTQRLPRAIGLMASLPLILAGKSVDAKKALKLGLVSDVVPAERLLARARTILREKIYLSFHKQENFIDWVVESTPLKKLIFYKARKDTLKETRGFYPAPLKIIDVIEQSFGGELAKGLEIEAKAFSELAVGKVAKNLIHLFFATEELKKDRGASVTGFEAKKFSHLAVVGAGIMGGGIAAVAASKGIRVRMKDVMPESIAKGVQTAMKLFQKDLKRKKIDASEYAHRKYRLAHSLTWDGFQEMPVVIEAVIERMDIKKQVFQELERILPEHAIIATNTSSLSVSEMASVLKNPSRAVGMHFFNPVPQMPLLEVVRGDQTSPEVIVQAVAFGKQLGKTVIVVRDRPGFLINRILMPYLIECAHLKLEGYSVEQIDRAARAFGMPMGPFRLLDEIGFDTGVKVADVIATSFSHMKIQPLLKELVDQGYLGKKNQKGFYLYDSQQKEAGVRSEFQSEPKDPSDATTAYLQDRLILPMVTEAIMALDENIIDTVRNLDLGLIYGIGFAPFRGGLLKYVSSEGERAILDRFYALHQKTSGRLLVPSGLQQRVQAGQTFYAA